MLYSSGDLIRPQLGNPLHEPRNSLDNFLNRLKIA